MTLRQGTDRTAFRPSDLIPSKGNKIVRPIKDLLSAGGGRRGGLHSLFSKPNPPLTFSSLSLQLWILFLSGLLNFFFAWRSGWTAPLYSPTPLRYCSAPTVISINYIVLVSPPPLVVWSAQAVNHELYDETCMWGNLPSCPLLPFLPPPHIK
jgi:hypothetical protein